MHPLSSPAHLYDGAKQLPGTLELRAGALHFLFDDFKHSHLDLTIPLSEIETATVFLLFNISNHGLKVSSKGEKIDLFILEDSKMFCEAIKNQMRRI